MSMKKDTFLA